jgi:hypothetical protein
MLKQALWLLYVARFSTQYFRPARTPEVAVGIEAEAKSRSSRSLSPPLNR